MSSYRKGAVISCGDKTSVALLASHIGSCYKLSKICDLVIVTGDDKAVFCHKLVLCSLSRTLLDICVGEESGNETTCVYLPDFSYEAVKALVDKIYESMGKQLVEIARTELTAILGVEDVPLTSYFKTEGVPDRYSVKIECDPDKVIIENEKVTESHGTEDKEEVQITMKKYPLSVVEEDHQPNGNVIKRPVMMIRMMMIMNLKKACRIYFRQLRTKWDMMGKNVIQVKNGNQSLKTLMKVKCSKVGKRTRRKD